MTYRFKIEGLDELKDSINPNRIRKSVAIGIGQLALSIHSGLKSEIFRNYQVPYSLDSVLIGKSTSLQLFGRNITRNNLTLEYENIGIPLARYSSGFYEGNIPPLPKKRLGVVEQVKIKRNQEKTVYGQRNYGGFIPRTKDRRKVQFGSFGTMMFERQGKNRFPVKQLYGPSLAQLANHIYRTSPKIQNILDSAPEFIAKELGL